MSEVVRSTHSLEWNPVTFKLTEQTPDGPPAVGVSIAFTEQLAGAPRRDSRNGPGVSRTHPALPTSAWSVPANIATRFSSARIKAT